MKKTLCKGETKNYPIPVSWKLTVLYKVFDFFQTFSLPFRIKKQKTQNPPQRILLSNWGSLGDVVLSSGVIAAIRDRYPKCQIGFLVSSRSKVALEACPHVDWIHVVEMWYSQQKGMLQKLMDLLHYIFIQQPKIVKEIATINYDCAIELRFFFPNIIPVFWKAGIPLRIGFTTSGNRLLLNGGVEWIKNQYLAHCYWDLLEIIGIYKNDSRSLMPCLYLDSSEKVPLNPYVIFHVCASRESKELNIAFWKELYQHCRNRDYLIYFTGQGEREHAIISAIVGESKYNLCNKLSWKQLIAYIHGSRGLVSVDSAPVHLAASFQVPCAVLFKATPSIDLWKPNISSTVAFGVTKEVQIEEVFQVVKQWMSVS